MALSMSTPLSLYLPLSVSMCLALSLSMYRSNLTDGQDKEGWHQIKGIKERGEEHAMVTKRKVDNIITLS